MPLNQSGGSKATITIPYFVGSWGNLLCLIVIQQDRESYGLLPENWPSWTVSFVECEREESRP